MTKKRCRRMAASRSMPAWEWPLMALMVPRFCRHVGVVVGMVCVCVRRCVCVCIGVVVGCVRRCGSGRSWP